MDPLPPDAQPPFGTRRLSTVKEVARRLRVKPPTVQKRIRDGILPAIKDGRGYLVDEADLLAYLDRNRV